MIIRIKLYAARKEIFSPKSWKLFIKFTNSFPNRLFPIILKKISIKKTYFIIIIITEAEELKERQNCNRVYKNCEHKSQDHARTRFRM